MNFFKNRQPFEIISFIVTCLGLLISFFMLFLNSNFVYNIAFVSLLLCFFILLVYHLQHKKSNIGLKNLYYKDTPLISTMTYILSSQKHISKNAFSIFNVEVSYIFNTQSQDDKFSDNCLPLTQHTIMYNFRGKNETSNPITEFSSNLAHSIFFNSSKIKVSAIDNDKNHVFIPSIEPANSLMDLLKINFTDCGIAPTQNLNLSIMIDWNNIDFKNAEHFIFDPWQYSNNKTSIKFTFKSNNNTINNSYVSLLEFNRDTFEIKKIYSNFFNQFNHSVFSIPRKLYFIRIEC